MGALIRVWYALLFILIVGLFLYDNVWWIWQGSTKSNVENKVQIFGKIINISNNHFYIYTGHSNLKINSSNMPPVRKAKYGETIVYAVNKDNVIEGIDYHNYDYNYVLYILSFIALIIFLVILFREWKLTLKGFEDA